MRTTGRRRKFEAALVFLAIMTMLLAMNRHENRMLFGLSIYGGITIGYLLLKLLLSSWYRPYRGSGGGTRTYYAVVIPFYNEEPRVLKRCLESVLRQTLPAQEIYIIDDGSADDTCYRLAKDLLREKDNAQVLRCDVNRNKRNAQSAAFRSIQVPITITLDSDTVLDENAIEEGLRPFADPAVQAVSGNVRALNAKTNLLTRLIDMRYCNAFRYERAAYSTLDSVLCSSGVFSLWRTRLIQNNLQDYLDQKFFSMPVVAGDDRRLSYYALREGKSVFQETAGCATVVPDTLGKFFKQQVRWNKSFFRETINLLARFPLTKPAWWLALSELCLWLLFGILVLLVFVIKPIVGGRILGLYYFGYIALMAYVRSVRYMQESFFVYLLSPLYALIHIFLLLPVRIYSLCTIMDDSWGTRS
ncbi:MAG: glycosyltransferase [Elusimicrobiota bacterium]